MENKTDEYLDAIRNVYNNNKKINEDLQNALVNAAGQLLNNKDKKLVATTLYGFLVQEMIKTDRNYSEIEEKEFKKLIDKTLALTGQYERWLNFGRVGF